MYTWYYRRHSLRSKNSPQPELKNFPGLLMLKLSLAVHLLFKLVGRKHLDWKHFIGWTKSSVLLSLRYQWRPLAESEGTYNPGSKINAYRTSLVIDADQYSLSISLVKNYFPDLMHQLLPHSPSWWPILPIKKHYICWGKSYSKTTMPWMLLQCL